MSLDIIEKTNSQFELLSGGSDGSCYVHDVKLKIVSEISGSKTGELDTPNDGNLRRRHFSFSTQQSREDDVEENIGGDESSKRIPTAAGAQEAPNDKSAHSARRDSKGNRASPIRKVNNPPIDLSIPEYAFEFTAKLSFKTDFKLNDPYQKLIRYSSSANLIFSAGSEGVIRFWSFPNYKEVCKFDAHDRNGTKSTEVNDMDVHPAGTHLISISSDGSNSIWSTTTGNLLTSLNLYEDIPKHSDPKSGIVKNVKYVAKKCRYGTVEGNKNSTKT